MTANTATPSSRDLLVALIALLALLGLSAWRAFDLSIWAMEVAPVFIAVPILLATHRRFPLTGLLYALIFVHALILMLGGHYTYAKVPLGFWMQDWFGWTRNNYDKIGHFAQGFVPAMAARELLLRLCVVTPRHRGWLFALITLSCLGISAFYEFIEWWTALALGSGADEFLATQGDPWDTQSDMCMAWIGAMLAQLLLGRWHDRQLAKPGSPA
jgi:putative membrane protein